MNPLYITISFILSSTALLMHMSKYAFAALEKLVGYHIKPRGEMQIKVSKASNTIDNYSCVFYIFLTRH